ncbi:MAG TPA: aliphatic sulfonate ABC transporter substrate-binding protein [Gaiellaceae bacterium]|jgi:sulfonate transport system substrate-binding protein|nr:aliphatic sulfonate ABC transporter substrate-binding protein [Gaiellaceae bacterium]
MRKTWIAAGTAAVTAAVVVATATTAAGDSKPTLVVGQQESGIISLVEDSGALKGAPYNVKWAVFPFGPPEVQAVAAGQVDVGTDIGDVPPINGAATTAGFKVIAAIAPPSYKQAGNYLLVPKGSPIRTLKDLKGKKVGVPFGSSAHGLLLNAVKSVGLSPSTVSFVNLQPSALQAAFNGGKVDAISIWNPQAAVDILAGARVLLAGRPPLDPDVGFAVGNAKDLADPAKRKLIADLLKRLAKAYAWGDQHPAAWVKDIQKETGVDQKTAQFQVDNGKILIQYITPSILKTEQTLADAFYAAKQITKPVDVHALVDNVLPVGFNGRFGWTGGE